VAFLAVNFSAAFLERAVVIQFDAEGSRAGGLAAVKNATAPQSH
jgi:hypothetical protein